VTGGQYVSQVAHLPTSTLSSPTDFPALSSPLLSSHRSSAHYLIPSQMENITRIPDFASTPSSASNESRQYVTRTTHRDITPFIDPRPNLSSPPLPPFARRLLRSRAAAPSSPGAFGALDHLACARSFAAAGTKGLVLCKECRRVRAGATGSCCEIAEAEGCAGRGGCR